MFPLVGTKQSVRSRDTVRFYLAVRRLTGFIGGATGRVRVECVLSPPSLVNVTTRVAISLSLSLSLSLSSMFLTRACYLSSSSSVPLSTWLTGWLVGWLTAYLPFPVLSLAYHQALNRSIRVHTYVVSFKKKKKRTPNYFLPVFLY